MCEYKVDGIWLSGGQKETHYGPTHDAIFHHQVLCQRRRDLGHVMPVVFFAHAWLPIAADGEAEKFAVRYARRLLGIHRQGDGGHAGCVALAESSNGNFGASGSK